MTIDRTAIDFTIRTFDALSVGDVFLDLDTEFICMKIARGKYLHTCGEDEDFNAIDLSDGMLIHIKDSNTVQLLEAQIIVKLN